MNAQRVLDLLRASGPMRVTEVVAATGLSRPTVDAVADELVRLGWLSEAAAVEGARGRPARSLAFRADAGDVVGVDIGEVKVRCAVADLRGRVVAERVRRVRRRGPAAGDPPRAGRGDRGGRRGAAAGVRRVHRRDEPRPRPRAVLERLPRRFRPGRGVRPRVPGRDRERLQPGGDRRALVRRRARSRRRRLRARGRADRRGDHGRREPDARSRGRRGRARLPRRVRGRARRPRHRPARPRARRARRPRRCSRPRGRATRRRWRSSSAPSAGPGTGS